MRHRLDNVILAISAANARKWEAIRQLKYVISSKLRAGDELTYMHGDNLVECVFVEAIGEDVRVRGRTGKVYDIGAYRIESVWR